MVADKPITTPTRANDWAKTFAKTLAKTFAKASAAERLVNTALSLRARSDCRQPDFTPVSAPTRFIESDFSAFDTGAAHQSAVSKAGANGTASFWHSRYRRVLTITRMRPTRP
jgi:hypothetical protein